MKLSAFLSTAFRHRFRAQLIKNRKTMIAISVMQLAGICAVPAFALYLGSIFTDTAAPRIYESAYSSGKLLTVFSYIWAFPILTAAVTLVLAACEAVTQFRYLHRKPDTDTVLALPLTRTQLFAADWLSGLVTVAAPVILASSAAALIMLFSDAKRVITPDIAQSFIPQPVPVLSGYYDPLQTPDFYLPFYLYSVTDFSLLERFISAYIPAVIMIYTFTVSVSVCCGTVFESAVYTVLSGTVLTLFPAALKTAFRASVPNSEYFWPLAESEVISPFGGIIRIVCSVLPDAGIQMNGSTGTYRHWALLHILTALIYLAAAWILFSKRKAEDTEKPFAYPALFYVVSFLITGSLVFLFASYSGRKFSDRDFAGYLPVPFAAAAVIFLVMLAVKDRGPAFRNPLRQILFFLCSFAVSALVSVSLIIAD